MPIEQIKKRDGRVVEFDQDKIERAIAKAFAAENAEIDSDIVSAMTAEIVAAAEEKFTETYPSVEDIQDIVERTIAAHGYFEVARSYILYREKHKQQRERQQAERLEKMKHHQLTVKKRDGSEVPFDVNEITKAVSDLAGSEQSLIDINAVVRDATRNLFDNITTKDINLSVVMALRARIERDPAYSRIAARCLFNDLYKDVIGINEFDANFQSIYKEGFANAIQKGIEAGRLDDRMRSFDFSYLSKHIDQSRDNLFKYLGAQTLYDRYFLRDHDQNILETPQYFWMRVAMGLSLDEAPAEKEARVVEFYNTMSQLYYVPSTPTLFHSGTTHPQMSSCYLTTVEDDLTDIFKSIGDNAQLSKWSGGLGCDWTNIRATGALIKSTNVGSQGVVPFLKIVDTTTAAINRSGKRRGATCVYLETWHYDIEDFLELRKNTGDERRRTHDTNTANWVPDLFMERLLNNQDWTLFSPDEAPDLHHIYGSAFKERYEEYEKMAEEGKIKLWKKIPAKKLWRKMITMLYETGHPWITFKDPSNIRSPQDHVGVVHSSNLCTEITLNTSSDETAVCNLGSVNLPQHITAKQLDKNRLERTVTTAMRMLDNVIDLNYYPTKEAKNSNLRHRPVGLGVMGLQDALYDLGIPFDSDEAVEFSDETQELISYHAILNSSRLARERGAYESYAGSKWSRGIFPLDTIDLLEEERGIETGVPKTGKLDWSAVKAHVAEHGMRNSNTMAIAPTATIANISGSLPSIEPIYKNIYVKSNFSGEFTVINHRLVSELKERGLWNDDILEQLKDHDGSVQHIEDIPQDVKETYKEVFEIDPIWIVRHAVRRGKWIDQSQSVNVFTNSKSGKEIADIYTTAWRMGLKTTYYLRSLGASAVEKSTLDITKKEAKPAPAIAQAQPAAQPVEFEQPAMAVQAQPQPEPVAAKQPTVYIAEDAVCEACE